MFTTLKRILSIRREPVKPVIDVVVTSNDLFWDQITEDLQKNGYSVTSNAKKILFDVFPQAGTSYRLVIVKVPGEKISYSKARRFGKKCGYKLLPIEVASLLAKAVSGVELKAHGILWVGCMSKPIGGLSHDRILAFGRNSDESLWFGAVEAFLLLYEGSIPLVFRQGGAFAFLLPNNN
ncbi:MAG: hypothetical protein AAB868_02650 [Patescibacteria group bacterium]